MLAVSVAEETARVRECVARLGISFPVLLDPSQDLSPYALELRAFARTVNGLELGPTSGASERRSLAIIEAGLESAATRRPIDLRQRYPDIWADLADGDAR